MSNVKQDRVPLEFGKYKGKTPDEIADIDAAYIVWLYNNVTVRTDGNKHKLVSKVLYNACVEDI